MKNIKTYKEFKEPTVSWEELAKDFREDKRGDENSIASKPFNAEDIQEIQPANQVIQDKEKKNK